MDPAMQCSAPVMVMSELRQKVSEWYNSQQYSDKTLSTTMSVMDTLCTFMGRQVTYTPQVGNDYLDSLADRQLSFSSITCHSRLVYILNCLITGDPIQKIRKRYDVTTPLGSSYTDASASMPMFQLQMMLEKSQPDLFSTRYTYIFDAICYFLGNHAEYSQQVGQEFLKYITQRPISERYVRSYKRLIYILDCLITGVPIRLRQSENIPLVIPPGFETVFNEYISHCERQNNREGTIWLKRHYVSQFLNSLSDCGCQSAFELTPEAVLQGSLVPCPPGAYTCYRGFLKYIADEEISIVDFSPLIPTAKRRTKVPDVYSKDEILRLEASYNRETAQGKRDYAIVLMASRLKLRPSDIVKLKFSEVDYEHDHIQFSQKKTGKPLQLPLLAEVKEALQDYIKVRPDSDSPYVFLRTHAPYQPLCRCRVHGITTEGFKEAGIDPNGRRTGPRALRSSGATHMINSGESYKIVSDSLGHEDRNVIQHYARLDIIQLRKCALTPLPVTKGSTFERILKGEVVL